MGAMQGVWEQKNIGNARQEEILPAAGVTVFLETSLFNFSVRWLILNRK
jgi:hypothetical protein